MSQRVRRIETESPVQPVALRPAPEAAGAPAGADPLADGAALHAELAAALQSLQQASAQDPFANPIGLLAMEVLRRLDAGALSEADLERLIRRLTVRAFLGRAERLGRYLGDGDPEGNRRRLAALLRRLARAEDGAPLPFARFREAVDRELFGIVVTAHPTFSQTADLMRIQAQLALGRDAEGRPLSAEDRAALVRAAAEAEHRPERAIDLNFEHALSVEAIRNIQAALRQVYDCVLEVAQELYPDGWERLTPRLLTVASWVGYDLDGRSDITWSDSFLRRLVLEAEQLAHCRAAVQAVRRRHAEGPEALDLAHTLELLDTRLALAAREVASETAAFSAIAAEQARRVEEVRAVSRRMYEELPQRLIETGHILELVEHAVGLVRDPAGKRALCILRAEIANFGLGMAHTHVRLNATQVHNAIRKTIGMETAPDDPSRRRSYVAAVTQLIAAVEPVQVNFGSVLAERASAKRLMMLVAQMLKYVDASTPVRFLIAECETSLTLLTALYYARLFGVADRIDISPLFETTKAFERAVRVIDDCLQNPEFAAYLRRRGRLCVQTGFSDAGRHLGQTTAAAAIERLRLRLGNLLADRGFADVELVMFNTHGESIGRGAHPGSFMDRLAYVMSPASRRLYRERGIRCKEEVTFQGGDGYLYFITPAIALATLTRVLEFVLAEPEPAAGDPYYRDDDYISEFFIAIQKLNERLMADADYAALLDAFGTNLLYPAGSRAFRREHEGPGVHVDLAHPTQLRAIPHNAILQQLAMMSNVIGGVGQAIANDPEKFQRFYRDSPRFRRLFAMVEWALEFSDADVLKAYVDLFDPGLWLQQLAHAEDPARALELRHAAEHLEAMRRHERLARIFRVLLRDLLDLKAQLSACRAGASPAPPLIDGIGEEARRDLMLMHALRIALIQRLFRLAAHIPDFSDQHDITREELIAKLFHLEVEAVLRLLAKIFPLTEAEVLGGDFGEPATYRSEGAQSYAQEHERIFQPMARLYELARAVGVGITHTIGAHG
ncbi:MAG: phosphoenolpyruvate carboxylase [Rhodospirillaceae bacterium]|nr:phosphoenolpyruvate carboxylase [Rhodospirillaceae bacterium]